MTNTDIFTLLRLTESTLQVCPVFCRSMFFDVKKYHQIGKVELLSSSRSSQQSRFVLNKSVFVVNLKFRFKGKPIINYNH